MRDLKDFVAACTIYTQTKVSSHAPMGPLVPVPITKELQKHLYIDSITGFPPFEDCTVIWVRVETFSKMAHFILFSTIPSAAALTFNFIGEIYRLHSMHIDSDKGV